MSCKCNDKKDLELAVCIAPPPGEHDLEIEISKSYSIVINDRGIHLKQIVIDDSLPFARTIMRKVDPGFLNRVILKIPREKIPCLAAKALIEAAKEGSLAAKKKIKECEKLVTELLNQC